MLALYTMTIFLAAALLFLVQPMAAKTLLPRLGGSPAVWNTAMVFFQGALLAGYGWAAVLARRRSLRVQAVLQALLVVAPLALLPIVLAGTPPGDASPALWVLGVLAVSVGPFFAVLATVSPLLQSWFARSGHPAAADPYFLYAASNAGSLLALLGYPLLVEPNSALSEQWRLWAAGHALVALLLLACAALAVREARPVPGTADPAARAPVAPGMWARWLALAFVPSSLSLAVTQLLSTDVAAVPLLWVVPLAIYLLTFILAFAQRVHVPLRAVSWGLAAVAVPMALTSFLPTLLPVVAVIVLQLVGLFLGALLCHARLAALRPPAERLTDFYLALSTGGVLGGVFCALVAPLVFDVVAEYPITLVLVLLARPARAARGRLGPGLDVLLPVVALPLALWLARQVSPHLPAIGTLSGRALLWVVTGAACLAFIARPRAFGFAVGMLLALGQVEDLRHTLHVERTFFGVSAVMADPQGAWHSLAHGPTEHGRQATAAERRRLPTTYFHPTGPLADIIRGVAATGDFDRVAVVGLGAGTVAAYGQPGQRMDFYEIDPAVVRIASDPRFFTYLSDSAADVRIVVGDGRLELAEVPDGSYDLIVLDAFSSDAPPVHLLTTEALQLYFAKLRPGGVAAVNVSSRTLGLVPVLTSAAAALGLVSGVRIDGEITPQLAADGKRPSLWVVLARQGDPPDAILPLTEIPGWREVDPPPGFRVWTDDYSNIVSVLAGR